MATSSAFTRVHVELQRARPDHAYGSRYGGEPGHDAPLLNHVVSTSAHLPMGNGARLRTSQKGSTKSQHAQNGHRD